MLVFPVRVLHPVMKTTSMEESNAMTVEFLRARLLSERSVSKSARQRADELAKRVTELEEQLKFVSLQRKKAEKATADVLAILENHGISDFSEDIDSFSDQVASPRNFKAFNGSPMMKIISTSMKPSQNEVDAYSGSEVESAPSSGRSLSWRSTKDSQHSLENKKFMDLVRRRASFASNSSSARKVGKSCRRIRHREPRSTEESQNDGTDWFACSVDAFDGSNGDLVVLRESSAKENGKTALASASLGSNSETRKMNLLCFNVHRREEDMESALQHQARLIGQYEEEEKVQREWEEKFRKNNCGTQDSGDPGNHSDVTEERYEMKSPELSHAPDTLNSDNQEMKQKLVDACPQTSNILQSPTDTYQRSLYIEKCSSTGNACESSASEFSFPTSNEKSGKDFSSRKHEASEHRFQQYPSMALTMTHGSTKTSSYEKKSMPLSASNSISSSLELAVVPQEPSNNLGSVLDALQKAKLSLNKKLNNSPSISAETSCRIIQPSNAEPFKVESFQIPFGMPGLFRLPTDFQFETGTDARPMFPYFLSENSPRRFLESRSAISGDLFFASPYSPFARDITQGVSPERSLGQPRLNEGLSSMSRRMNNLDPYTNLVLPSVKDSYPFLPDITLQLPPNEEGTSSTFPSSLGLPSVVYLSSYDEHVRPNIYR